MRREELKGNAVNNNNNVLFYALFLEIGAHSPLQNKVPKHSQN